MDELAKRICSLLHAGRPAAVATILSRKGSAPRTAGSKMVVDAQGGFSGTIGGGKLEAEALAAAKQVLVRGRPTKLFFDLAKDDAASMDMICGGKTEVLIDYLAPEGGDPAAFDAWRAALQEARPGSLITVVTGWEDGSGKAAHCMVFADGSTVGDWPLSEALRRQMAQAAGKAAAQWIDAEDAQVLVEPTAVPSTLLLFGAGHVSMPTARLAGEVGFRVVVVDDRAAFANSERFPGADQIRVPEDFASAFSGLDVDADTFVVIVTRGHRFDKEVLAGALRTEAGYIGMIGSRKKRDAIYAALKQDGFSETDLARVHCPIGLSIGAETPAEIAVSIVAELIACRAGMNQ